MKIVEMIPKEVRIYPDGEVVEIYEDEKRLVVDEKRKQEYVNLYIYNKMKGVKRKIKGEK